VAREHLADLAGSVSWNVTLMLSDEGTIR
jgi:hypothetical protein